MNMVTINQVFPWGRSFDEYRLMFNLSDDDLKRKIVGCGDGPASFNAQMARRGHPVISCDPLYQFATEEMRQRIDATYPEMVAFAQKNHAAFVWDTIRSPIELGQIRREAMEGFLADYDQGKQEGRYLVASLPSLPFADRSFDVALCSHLLFLYSQQFPLEFHLAAVTEMARIAQEVRVFPLVDQAGQRSCHLDQVIDQLAQQGYTVMVEKVGYEFQRGGNQMLRVTRM